MKYSKIKLQPFFYILSCSRLGNNLLIISNICTHHSSNAAVTCAKFCYDQFHVQWLKIIPPSAVWSHCIIPPSAVMSQWTGSTFLQVMACRLFVAKPLWKPMLTCKLLSILTPRNKLHWNSNQNTQLDENVVRNFSAILCRWGGVKLHWALWNCLTILVGSAFQFNLWNGNFLQIFRIHYSIR